MAATTPTVRWTLDGPDGRTLAHGTEPVEDAGRRARGTEALLWLGRMGGDPLEFDRDAARGAAERPCADHDLPPRVARQVMEREREVGLDLREARVGEDGGRTGAGLLRLPLPVVHAPESHHAWSEARGLEAFDFSVLIGAGNISIPLAVLTGVVQ